MVSCSDDDNTDGDGDTPNDPVVKSGVITANETWTSDNVYELDGRVIVDANVTLTIEAGTVIKGREGTGSLASVLVVARGATIMAQGTAANPIIFTSVLDEIEADGVYVGNLDRDDNELWGGVIILGSAPISAKEGDTEALIEGLPADETYGLYGASDASGFDVNDNSGVFSYVSIRHGGITIGEGNEINGLTLGGVGAGTTISNIEIYATLDDGVEFFGGSVDAENVLVYWQGDDGIDIDMNWSGTLDNFIVSHGDGVETDEGLEIDGPENTLKDGFFTLINGTIISDGVDGTAADLKSDAQGTLSNLVFSGYAAGDGVIKVEGEYEADCAARSGASFTDALGKLLAGDLEVVSSTVEGVKVYSKEDDNKEPICGSIPSSDQEGAEALVISSSTATGADASVFNWTATVASGVTF